MHWEIENQQVNNTFLLEVQQRRGDWKEKQVDKNTFLFQLSDIVQSHNLYVFAS